MLSLSRTNLMIYPLGGGSFPRSAPSYVTGEWLQFRTGRSSWYFAEFPNWVGVLELLRLAAATRFVGQLAEMIEYSRE